MPARVLASHPENRHALRVAANFWQRSATDHVRSGPPELGPSRTLSRIAACTQHDAELACGAAAHACIVSAHCGGTMGLREVRELVDACEGLPDGILVGKRAKDLTIGDLRLLLRLANLMGADIHDARWQTRLDGPSSQPTRAD